MTLIPSEAIGVVAQEITALPACIAGSAVSAETYGLPFGKFSDVDVFCFSKEALISGVQRLLAADFTVDDRHARVWHRWLKYGVGGWHTNSLKMHDPTGDIETNLIFKVTNKIPLTSLSDVLESFDFGLLATGYDMEVGIKRDMRSYLFPTYDIDGPLPMMPARRDAWRGGFISQYQGLRELGRYAKYAQRGYDMSLVKDDLVEGYLAAASYMATRTEEDKLLLSRIYYAAGEMVLRDDFDELEEAGKQLITLDSLDAIMEAIE